MIRKALFGILLLSCSYAGLGQTGLPSAGLTRARFLIMENKYGEAVEILKSLPGGPAGDQRASLAMGQALAGIGLFTESNRWLISVTAEGAADATYRMALNFLSLGNVPEAMRCLELHLADRNHYPEKQIRLDPAFSSLDNNRDWIKAWRNEWYSQVEQDVAQCEYMLSIGQAEEALELATEISSKEPGYARALFVIAKIRMERKESRQAMQMIDLAWNTAAGDIRLREDILRFVQVAGPPEKVTDLAGQLIRQDPGNPEYLIIRALSRIGGGKESSAQQELQAIEELGIAPAELYYQAGKRIAASAPRQAEQYLGMAVDSEELDARYFYQRGLVRISLEKYDDALADLAMSLDINPNQPDLYLARAGVRHDLGDTDGACHDWRRALEMGNAKAADLLYKFCKLPR